MFLYKVSCKIYLNHSYFRIKFRKCDRHYKENFFQKSWKVQNYGMWIQKDRKGTFINAKKTWNSLTVIQRGLNTHEMHTYIPLAVLDSGGTGAKGGGYALVSGLYWDSEQKWEKVIDIENHLLYHSNRCHVLTWLSLFEEIKLLEWSGRKIYVMKCFLIFLCKNRT